MGIVAVGENIPLTVLVEGDTAPTKFVRAVLTDADGDPLPSSPKSLAYVAHNLFQDLSVAMPDTAFVNAQFQVYDDAGFTVPSDEHELGSAGERFDRASPKLDQILNKIQTVGSVDILETTIEPNQQFVATLTDDNLNGIVGENVFVAEISEDELQGTPGEDGLTAKIGDC